MLALLVFRHSSRPRHICHFFLRFTYVGTFRNINFDFSNSRASQMMNRSMKRVDGLASEPTTVTRLVSERDKVSAELGSRGTRRGNKPVGWVTDTRRRVFALLMWRTRYLCGCVCAPGRPVATNSALRAFPAFLAPSQN